MTRHTRLLGAALTLVLGAALQPLAANSTGVSWTAEVVCNFRAVAALHPDPKLRNGDSLAARFCDAVLLPNDYAAARDVIDVDPEAYASYFYVNARSRHIDAQLLRAVAEGAAQVVVLGAGFDSRAYRFHARYPGIVFFEVDTPPTISAKQQTVVRVYGALPRHVHYAPIDFNTQSLASVLSAAGYEATKKTFFILEGVSMYVSEAGNGATFDFIRRHSAPGSRLVYDYILRRVVEGDYAGLYAAKGAARGVASHGEPFVTGWTPEEAEQFAHRRGFKVLGNLDAAALTRRYLTGSNGKADGRMPNWYGIVDARVP